MGHLVYELMLTNAVPAAIVLNTVEVHDANSGTTLARLTGDSLRAATSLPTSPELPSNEVPPSAVTFVWLDVAIPADDVPAAVTHRITVDRPAGVPLSSLDLEYTGAAVQVDRRPAVAIGPPVQGAGWAALGSCCDGPHRRALYPIDGRWYLAQRFAIDFNQLDPQNRPGSGDPKLPTSYPSFGQPVFAVADGTVAVASDGDRDLQVGEQREEPTPDNAGGNHVVIDLGDGRFAVYAHLQQHSISVRQGERVERGRHIANVGSSGTTGGPHLHFQLTDRPSVVMADGMPYTFESFDLTGQTPPLTDVLRYYDTLAPIPISAANHPGLRHEQLPLGRDVVSFPAIGGHG